MNSLPTLEKNYLKTWLPLKILSLFLLIVVLMTGSLPFIIPFADYLLTSIQGY